MKPLCGVLSFAHLKRRGVYIAERPANLPAAAPAPLSAPPQRPPQRPDNGLQCDPTSNHIDMQISAGFIAVNATESITSNFVILTCVQPKL